MVVMRRLFILFVITILVFPPVHSNELNWKIGDCWKYERIWRWTNGSIAFKEIVEYEVIKRENITFYGKNYYAYRVIERIYYLNYTINLTSFYRVHDLAYIGGDTLERAGWYIYDPPIERFKFLEVGKKWNQTITRIYNWSSYVENKTFTIYYECIKKEDVKTRAGNFKCYVIKEQKEGDPPDCYYLYYFSPSIKNVVMLQHSLYGEILPVEELIYTTYGEKTHTNLYFALIIAFIVFITYIIFNRYLKKKKKW